MPYFVFYLEFRTASRIPPYPASAGIPVRPPARQNNERAYRRT